MKILHIIGNGFDLSLGLKTSYKEFYDYYKSVESSKNCINDLKKNISSNYKNWSDLELALGQYTEEIKTINEFDDVFEDIGEQLAEYLKKEEAKFNTKTVYKEEFFLNLVNPEIFLSVNDSNIIREYKNKFINQNWFVDIVTFNYTSIIDKIIENKKNIKIGNHRRSDFAVTLRSVEHIHGYTENRMVLGVNDISQIKNRDFHNNIDVIEAIVKSKCNEAYGHAIDIGFKNKISQADLISIFGSSIGDTDNVWWDQIAVRLKKSPIPILIFTKGEEVISPRIGYKNNRTKRKMLDYFIKKLNLEKDLIDAISKNIYIALDTSMFSGILRS